MSSVVISGDTSGSITLSAPAVSGTNTATLPAATGTVMVSGNMPAFSAYINTNQSISAATFTKVQFNTEEFDTNSNYDNATNYRFTPTVAGYYQVNLCVQKTSIATDIQTIIYKNGSAFKNGVGPVSTYSTMVTALIFLNGTSDYVEGYVYMGAGGLTSSTVSGSFFQAAMVRTS